MIEVFPSGPFATNAYVISSNGEACIIDPGAESASRLTSYIQKNQLKVLFIVLTHSHWDHIADVKKLKNQYSCPVYLHQEDWPNMIAPGTDGLPLFFPIDGVTPEYDLKEGDQIDVGSYHFKVIHTPGHSPGCICLYDKDAKILISGDTLFQGTIGNLSFPTSDENRMWQSLKKLENLPKETVVYPGHGSTTTIGQEAWLPKAKEYFGA